MKTLPVVAFLIVLGATFLRTANAESKALPRGPSPEVLKTVDDHLFHVYVTPPKATRDYTPGKIVFMLQKKYPDYLYVSLTYQTLTDGTLKALVAISPERVDDYTVNVLDEQADGGHLMLYSKPLKAIARLKKKRAGRLRSAKKK